MSGLLDFLQAASNSAASNVSGPVDGIAWLLRRAGIPVPDDPVGGSKWMEQRGLTRPVQQGAAQVLGETAGLLGPIAVAAKAPQVAKGLLQAGDNLAAAPNVNRGLSGGQRGIFGGELAKTADKAALSKAKELEKAGTDPRAIWSETGWFKGGDGKWRFEIDDTRAGVRLEGPKFGANPDSSDYLRMAEVFDHRDAYKAYDDLRGINVAHRKEGGASYSAPRGAGQYEYMEVPIATGKDRQRSSILHELQHAVQQREGFARGGSPEYFTQQDVAEKARDLLSWQREVKAKLDSAPGMSWDAAERAVIDDYAKVGAPDWVPSSEVRKMARNPFAYFDDPPEQFVKLYGLDKRVSPYSPNDVYRRLAGEAEARAVQARMNLTPAQRRATFPLDSYDVPIDQLIYR